MALLPALESISATYTTTGVKSAIEVISGHNCSFAVKVNTNSSATTVADYTVEVRIVEGGSNWYPVNFVCGAATSALDSLNAPVSAFRINITALDALESIDFEILATGTFSVRS